MPSCTLRLYRKGDAQAMRSVFSDPDVMRFVGDGSTIDAGDLLAPIFAKYESDPTFYIWAIEEDGEYAGHAELKRRKGRREYELIYFLPRERWGRGLGKTVVDLLLDEAWRKSITFVIATVHPDNAASLAILRSRGFVRDDALSEELSAEAFRLDLPA